MIEADLIANHERSRSNWPQSRCTNTGARLDVPPPRRCTGGLGEYICTPLANRATGGLVRRYEHAPAGDLVHVDVKKLGNISDGGWRAVDRTQGTATTLPPPATHTPHQSEPECRAALDLWLHTYSCHRGHPALGGRPPTSRVPNLPGQNI